MYFTGVIDDENKLLNIHDATDIHEKVYLDRRLFWGLQSKFQGVIITPLVGLI